MSSTRLAAALVAMIAMVLVSVGVNSHRSSSIEDAQIQECEGKKQDRVDNARAWTAHEHYLAKVMAAASVKADVKRAASEAVRLEAESANSLRTRLLLCKPLIKDHRREIDKPALLEAKGKL